MKNRVVYYETRGNRIPVKEFINSLDKKTRAKILKIFNYIKYSGIGSVLPYIKKLKGTPLWEIRILGKTNVRIFYILAKRNTILILHGYVKKTEKTPKKEINTALNRLKIWKKRLDI